jgi:hypothetical protein
MEEKCTSRIGSLENSWKAFVDLDQYNPCRQVRKYVSYGWLIEASRRFQRLLKGQKETVIVKFSAWEPQTEIGHQQSRALGLLRFAYYHIFSL